MQVMAPGRALNRVPDLMEEAEVDAMDLVRGANLSINTAYRLANRNKNIKGVQYETVQLLCDFFTKKLGRSVTPDDLMWESDGSG